MFGDNFIVEGVLYSSGNVPKDIVERLKEFETISDDKEIKFYVDSQNTKVYRTLYNEDNCPELHEVLGQKQSEILALHRTSNIGVKK